MSDKVFNAPFKLKTEFLVSTKASAITEKVNKWLEEHDVDVADIRPFMSYTNISNKGSMMIGAMIKYYELEPIQLTSPPEYQEFEITCDAQS